MACRRPACAPTEEIMTDWTEGSRWGVPGPAGPRRCRPAVLRRRVPAAQGVARDGDLHQAVPPPDRAAHERGDRLVLARRVTPGSAGPPPAEATQPFQAASCLNDPLFHAVTRRGRLVIFPVTAPGSAIRGTRWASPRSAQQGPAYRWRRPYPSSGAPGAPPHARPGGSSPPGQRWPGRLASRPPATGHQRPPFPVASGCAVEGHSHPRGVADANTGQADAER